MKSKTPETLSDQFRRILAGGDTSLCQIARQTGVDKSVLSKFIRGQRGMSLDSVDRLARYFGIRLTVEVKTKTGKRKGG